MSVFLDEGRRTENETESLLWESSQERKIAGK